MNRKLEILKNLLAEILNYLLFGAVGTVIFTDIASFQVNRAELWVMMVLSVFYYGIRERCRHFSVFFLLHILPIGAFWALYRGNIFLKVWMAFVMVFLMLISFGKKIHSAEMGMNVIFPIAFGGGILVLYLIDHAKGGGDCGGLLLYVLIGYVVGYLGYYFLERFIHYIEINTRTTENIPVGHVFRSSMGLAGGFTALAGLVMVLGSDRELLDRIGVAIHQFILRMIRFLVSLLPKGAEAGEEIENILPESGQPSMPFEEMEAVEPSVFMKVLETLVGILTIAALAVLLVIAAVRLVKWLRDIFSKRKAVSGISEEAHEDLVEKLERQRDKAKEEKGVTIWERAQKAVSPEERIRRIYKKTVEKKLSAIEEKRKGELTCSETPREWCIKLFPEQENEALEFAVLYEKARYSFRLCNGEDVKRARKLAEGFHR